MKLKVSKKLFAKKKWVVLSARKNLGAPKCYICNDYVHVICGVSENEGYGSNILCILCNQNKDIEKERDVAFEGLLKQSKKMKLLSDKEHPPVEVGNTALLMVPECHNSMPCLNK